MNKNDVLNKLNRTAHRVGFKIKKHSPEILVVGGVVGMAASGVMACRATTKLSAIIEEKNEQLDKLEETVEKIEAGKKVKYEDENGNAVDYTVEDAQKDAVIIKVKAGLKVAKVYAPAVALGMVSGAAILGGHNILRKRNVALGAAYVTIDKSFKQYRGRVIDRFGEALDKELRYGVKSQEFEEIEVNDKGKEKVVKKNVDVIEVADGDKHPALISDYSKFFDESCIGWSKDAEANLVFLKQQQRFANEKLQTQGYLFLNEVYDMLGIDRTKAGQIVGWIYDEKNPNGDNYVDFGIYKTNRANRAFVNGYERVILLDFNVDGDILNLM